MPSPIRPSDIAATVPGQSSDFCTKFKLVFLTLPNLLNQFFAWLLNSDGSISDSFKSEVNPFSSGDLKWTVSSLIPSGWLRCEGQTVSRTTYASLFTVLGTTFGAGDGSNTFGLPDYRNRVLLGVSATKVLGAIGGEETHTNTVAEIPSHAHVVKYNLVLVQLGNGSAAVQGLGSTGVNSYVTESTGGGGAHNNLQPYSAAYCLIKT
jgi:microcystin-dependent protein